MKTMAILSLSLASAVLLGLGAPAVAAPPGHGSSGAVSGETGPLSLAERDDLTRQFVRKWGHYAQRVHGVPVDTWSERMVPSLMLADPDNFRAALQRDTFEGAMAEVSGTGKRLSDDEVISLLAASGDDGSIQTLGALSNDLVYTPLQPCRILDTRNVGGAIAANSTRNFITYAGGFAFQGGSATNCGTPSVATAVAINLTAVTPNGAGFATAFPFGTTQPTASSINYTAGAIVNNSLVVQTPNPLGGSDMTIYTFAQSHFVADIVGYFAPPVATAIQCVDTAFTTSSSIAAGGTVNVTAPACAAGYTQTTTNCEASTWDMPFVYINGGVCSAKNNGASAATVRASRTCCRVPGR